MTQMWPAHYKKKTDMKWFCGYMTKGERLVQRAAVCLYTYKTHVPEQLWFQQMSKNYITFTWQSSMGHCRQTHDGHKCDFPYIPLVGRWTRLAWKKGVNKMSDFKNIDYSSFPALFLRIGFFWRLYIIFIHPKRSQQSVQPEQFVQGNGALHVGRNYILCC